MSEAGRWHMAEQTIQETIEELSRAVDGVHLTASSADAQIHEQIETLARLVSELELDYSGDGVEVSTVAAQKLNQLKVDDLNDVAGTR